MYSWIVKYMKGSKCYLSEGENGDCTKWKNIKKCFRNMLAPGISAAVSVGDCLPPGQIFTYGNLT